MGQNPIIVTKNSWLIASARMKNTLLLYPSNKLVFQGVTNPRCLVRSVYTVGGGQTSNYRLVGRRRGLGGGVGKITSSSGRLSLLL